MAILANRVKIKSNILGLGRFITFSIRRFFITILICTSFYLLYFSPTNFFTTNLLEVTGKILSIGSGIYEESAKTSKTFYNRFSNFRDLEAENLRLKLKIDSLETKQQLALGAELENAEFRKILNVIPDVKFNFITAKVIGMTITPFSSFAVVKAGKEDGVKINDVVRSKNGLIGRIYNVSSNFSTIMLVNDHNSRIPVITSDSKNRGILVKHNDHLKIIYLKENHNAKIGETVYSSGDGAIYPKGIAVAIISHIANEEIFVKTIEDFNDIDFVIIESRPTI